MHGGKARSKPRRQKRIILAVHHGAQIPIIQRAVQDNFRAGRHRQQALLVFSPADTKSAQQDEAAAYSARKALYKDKPS